MSSEQLQDDGSAKLKVTPLRPTDRSPFDIHVNFNPWVMNILFSRRIPRNDPARSSGA